MNKFLKGTLLLVGAAFFGECIEFIVNMVLANELGERGMGLYMSILPSVFFIVLLASLELPISISKFVAEKDEKFHRSMLQHAIQITIIFTAVSLLAAAVVIPNVPVFDKYHPLFKWAVLLLIPLVSFSSIARGFFMGKHQMGKIALSNFLRKLLQLGLLVAVYQFFDFNLDTAVLIAFCTLVGSEFVVFLYLIHIFIVQFMQLKRRPYNTLSRRTVLQNLMEVSIPTTGMRVFHAFTHALQPFLIKAALMRSGISEPLATEHFGILAGVAMTIGFFPAFIAHSLLIMLIPTVSKAYSQNETSKLQRLLQNVLTATFIYGVPSVVVFYFFAEPLTNLFFHSPVAASYLQMLWPYFLFHFFVIPMQAYLIGLGLIRDAFIHVVWSTCISYGLIFLLGSLHDLQMGGVIIGMNTGTILLTLMHYLTIVKKLNISWSLKLSKQSVLK
ncbi:multidrug transporter MatE [Bacillus canaveralius]|uniref:Multidrug transporter MatE n=1 Tax=Bacillus canaveralius TaxID=1403243 RepID=A0A2N5GGZ2_9BACI|nr:polysaccharide biosynthesis protein [Bacillus canaveralius]PLR80036.1 multidrug transporter MatE [Bacillus canaveralius]PLR94934.1 multidrug transporter MatE [Bacillus canaveralius]